MNQSVLSLLILVTLVPAGTAAAASLTIDSPRSGSVLSDPVQTTILVKGRLFSVDPSVHDVRFERQLAPPIVTWTSPTEATFDVELDAPIGAQAFVPVLGEVFEISTDEVQDRLRVTLYDVRYYPGGHLAKASAPAPTQARLTPQGFERVSDLHEEIRTNIGFASAQVRADDAVALPEQLARVWTPKTCMDIADIAIHVAAQQAQIEDSVSDALRAENVSIPPNVLSDAVTGATPDVGIKVCLRSPRPTIERVRMTDPELDYVPETDLVEVDGTVDGIGADVQVGMRWAIKLNIFKLTGLPIPSVVLPMLGNMNCNGTWTAGSAAATFAEVGIAPGVNVEQLDVFTLTSAMTYDQPLAIGTIDVGGICTVPEFRDIAQSAIAPISAAVLPMVELAMWHEYNGNHVASAVLEEALDSMNIGLAPWTNGRLHAAFEQPAIAPRTPWAADAWGLSTLARNVTFAPDTAVGFDQGHTYTVPSPETVLAGRTPQGDDYDMASVTSTASVNAVLRAQATSTLMNFDRVAWTLSELGLCTPTSWQCDTPRRMTGRHLAVAVPEFADSPNVGYRFEYRPLFAPVVTMEPDPMGAQADAWMWVSGYEITIADDDTGRIAVRAVVDIGYDDLYLNIDDVEGHVGYTMSAPAVDVTLTYWDLRDKPEDADVETLMTAAAAPLLAALEDALPEVSAPEMQNITQSTQMLLSHNLDDEFRLYAKF